MGQPDDELALDALSIYVYGLYALSASAEVRFTNGPSVPTADSKRESWGWGYGSHSNIKILKASSSLLPMAQLIEQSLGVFQVGSIESFSEPCTSCNPANRFARVANQRTGRAATVLATRRSVVGGPSTAAPARVVKTPGSADPRARSRRPDGSRSASLRRSNAAAARSPAGR